MSPQSRRRKPSRPSPERKPPTSVAALVLKDLEGAFTAPHSLVAECWASTFLGEAWSRASGEQAEAQLVRDVTSAILTRPSVAGLAALYAFRRLTTESAEPLDRAIGRLTRMFAPPAWADAPPAVPVAAWRADDPWLSSRTLFLEYVDEAEQGYVLMVSATTAGGLAVDAIDLAPSDSLDRWDSVAPDRPRRSVGVEEALADMAEILTQTDMYWPRITGSYGSFRALAWSRCRAHVQELHWEPILLDRPPLLDDFCTLSACDEYDPELIASLGDLFIDFGEGYIDAHPLAWSPDHVETFLVGWLARKAALSPEQVEVLPDVLKIWVRFVLDARGLDERWIVAVEEAVDEYASDFWETFDDPSGWGPSKEITTALLARGVDLTDPASVEAGIRAYNAEQLARRAAGLD